VSNLSDNQDQHENQQQTLRLTDLTHHIKSKYDRVFDQEAKQDEVFEYVQKCVDNVVKGFNCTIFAYGQTGSGKTYTMFGKGFDT